MANEKWYKEVFIARLIVLSVALITVAITSVGYCQDATSSDPRPINNANLTKNANNTNNANSTNNSDTISDAATNAIPAKAIPVYLAWGDHESVSHCAGCHSQPNDMDRLRGTTEFVAMDEASTWLLRDKHAVARQRIEPIEQSELTAVRESLVQRLHSNEVAMSWLGDSNVRSARILKNLGWERATREGQRLLRENCYTCHGGYDAEQAKHTEEWSDRQPGISCTYCHQDSRVSDAWVDRHRNATYWRYAHPKTEKHAIYGMRDLTDVVEQSELCYSCHIGDRPSNRFVTHAMYEAGHPPLTNIELESFNEMLPKHWRNLDELAVFAKRDTEYFEKNFPEVYSQKGDLQWNDVFWRTRVVVISSILAKRQALQLLIDADSENSWPDFADFDCAACHHELRKSSARSQRTLGLRTFQEAAPAAVPGRPRLTQWVNINLDAALMIAGRDKSDHPIAVELEQALNDIPFGDPTVIAALAKQQVGSLDDAVLTAKNRVFDRRQSFSFMERLVEQYAQGPVRIVDLSLACHLVATLQVVWDEIKRHTPAIIDQSGFEKSLDDLTASLVPSASPESASVPTVIIGYRNNHPFDPVEFMRRLKQVQSDLQLLRKAGY